MADRIMKATGGFPARRYRDMGDGTFAEVVALAAALAGSTASIGRIDGAGITASANFTPAAAAYSAGDIQDVAKAFAFTFGHSGLAIPNGSLIRILTSIVKIGVNAVPSGMTSYTLPLHSVTPPSALADNAPWVPTAGDQASYRGKLALGTPALEVAGAGFLYIKTQYQDFDVKLDDAAASLYGYLVSAGGFTATAVARQVFLYGIVL